MTFFRVLCKTLLPELNWITEIDEETGLNKFESLGLNWIKVKLDYWIKF